MLTTDIGMFGVKPSIQQQIGGSWTNEGLLRRHISAKYQMKPEARLFPLCVCERDELTLSAHFSPQKNLIYFLLKKSLNFIIKPAQSTTDII